VAALNDAGYTYDVWSCAERAAFLVIILLQYAEPSAAVVWALPDTGYLATSETQSTVELFFEYGGNLLLAGQDTGFALRDADLLGDISLCRAGPGMTLASMRCTPWMGISWMFWATANGWP
jgi:hypothetical protein